MPFFSSVQRSHSVMFDSLQPNGQQHTRLPCPSLTPRVYSNSCPLSRWCHPAISSFVVAFSSCPQSLPASGSFPESSLCMRWPKYWSFSFSISPSNEHSGPTSPRMDWLDLLAVQGTLKSLLQHHSSWSSLEISFPPFFPDTSKVITFKSSALPQLCKGFFWLAAHLVCACVHVCWVTSVVSNSLHPYGL